MNSLFVPADREALALRLGALEPDTARRWGTMDPAQMLLHCALALEVATGDRPAQQTFLGKLITPFIRSRVLGDLPFKKKVPTDPGFVASGARDFDVERTRFVTILDRFVCRGPEQAAQATHPFFGRLSGEEWGRLGYKHLDHHLRQFGL